MSNELFLFPSGKVDPTALLEKAKEWGLKEVLILGWDENELVIGSSTDSLPDMHFLASRACDYFMTESKGEEEYFDETTN